jgi:hypothetical protein
MKRKSHPKRKKPAQRKPSTYPRRTIKQGERKIRIQVLRQQLVDLLWQRLKSTIATAPPGADTSQARADLINHLVAEIKSPTRRRRGKAAN